MSKGSFKIWLLMEQGHEHAHPVRAYALRRDAEAAAAKLERKIMDEQGGLNGRWPKVQQIDLVTVDGAHALHTGLWSAVGKNG